MALDAKGDGVNPVFLRGLRKMIKKDPQLLIRCLENSKSDSQRGGWVYVLRGALPGRDGPYYKIGKTNVGLEKRIKQINHNCYGGNLWEVAHTIRTEDAALIEKTLHYLFQEAHLYGEVFALSVGNIAWLETFNSIDSFAFTRKATSGDAWKYFLTKSRA